MMNDEQHVPGSAGPVAEADAGKGAEPSPAGIGVAEIDLSGPDDDQGEPGDDQEQAEQPQRGRGSFLTEIAVLLVIALTVALLVKTFVVQPFYIPTSSMEDTLMVGDKVLVNKLVYHLRPIQRGDVVVFNGDGSWLPPQPTAPPSSNPLVRLYDATLRPVLRSFESLFGPPPGQTDYIKRVIGLPGDRVACCNAKGQITVNGVALDEKSYLKPGNPPSQGAFSIVVPPGRLWVMGDHRSDSADSRLHDCAYTYMPPACVRYDRDGTIPQDKVIGRAFVIVWPPSRFRILPIPATFDQPALTGPARRGAAGRGAGDPVPAAGAIPVRPGPPYLPLAGGFAVAVPLTLAQRRVRLRYRKKRDSRLRHRRVARRPAGRDAG